MAQLPNNAKVSDIIASLQASTGINQKVDLAGILAAKGYTLTGNESMADLVTIINGPNLVNTTTGAGATAAQILINEEVFVNGVKITGNMPENGAINITPSSANQPIAAGHTSGGNVAAVVVPVANVLSGTTIAGQAGTMPERGNVGAINLTSQNQSYTIPAGHHNGSGYVQATYAAGKPYASGSGTVTSSSTTYTNPAGQITNANSAIVSGLNFPNGIAQITIIQVGSGIQTYYNHNPIQTNCNIDMCYQTASQLIQLTGNAYVSSNSFQLPINSAASGGSFTWEAWGL